MEGKYTFYEQHYGKKYAELVQNYSEKEDRDSYISNILDELIKDEEIKKIVIRMIETHLKINKQYNYFDGLKDGVHFSDELKEDKPPIYSDYVKNKDITIMLDFHDNDFGDTILEAAKEYTNAYNDLLKKINLYSSIENCERMVNSDIKRLEAMEHVNVIANFLSTALVAKDVLHNLSNSVLFKPETLGMEKYNFQSFKEKGFQHEEYLGLDKTENYHIGTYEEIEKYVVEEYKEMQDKDKGKTLDTCWLNGEVVFISAKNGEMKTWIQ